MLRRFLSINCFIALMLCVAPAYAYVGPGPGLSMLGSFFALISGVVIALIMVLLWPIRLAVKHIKARKSGNKSE